MNILFFKRTRTELMSNLQVRDVALGKLTYAIAHFLKFGLNLDDNPDSLFEVNLLLFENSKHAHLKKS